MSQPQKTAQRGWGSLLSGAVAGLESRLDNILADEETRAAEDAARKARLEAQQKQQALKVAEKEAAKATNKSRVNDRLAERLAKAAKGEKSSRPSSEVPSRTASPAPRLSKDSALESTRPSVEVKVEDSIAGATVVENPAVAVVDEQPAARIESPRMSTSETKVSSLRPSSESTRRSVEGSPQVEAVVSAPLKRSPSFLESEVSRLSRVHEENTRNYQEELHAHLERIDALQSKLEYLAKQAAVTARETATSAENGSLERKLAEQEERNALLLEEGNKLSKNEIKQRSAIMKLRQRVQEEEKGSTEVKRKLATSEEERSDLRDRLKIVEERERAAQMRLKSLSTLETDLNNARRDGEEAKRIVADLRKQLLDAERRADDAEKKAQTDKLEEQMRIVADLQDDIANAKIEKKLAEDRSKAEIRQLKEDAVRQQDKSQLAELELRNEISNLETKLELLRSKTEEVTSSTGTDAQAKLLRQVETLQTQYALASENWQTLESSLNGRILTLGKERDDIAKRESDVRKKAREISTKARRYEDDLEAEKERASTFETELNEQKAALARLQTRLSAAETAMAETKTNLERERKEWQKEMQTKLEEERQRWKAEHQPLPSPNPMSAAAMFAEHNHFLSASSPTASWTRKASDSALTGLYGRRSAAASRTYSSDLPPILTNDRPQSRRTPPTGHPGFPVRTNTNDSQLSREASSSHLNGLAISHSSVPHSASASIAPSIDIDGADNDRFDSASVSSPHRTVNELVSHSTMAAGPSVQLVERMSAAVRRLESEKAASKEEHARLLAQRDEAREEVVGMMREMETLKKNSQRLTGLETELGELKTRYEASLEMLGEKSEEVEELRDDLEEVKKIYKELLNREMK